MSSAYRAAPVAFPIPSLRATLDPTAGMEVKMPAVAECGKIIDLMS